jgi:hypothetical protein
MKFKRVVQIALVVAAMDCLAYGLYAWFRPEWLFEFLQFTTHPAIDWEKILHVSLKSPDEVLLWRLLGVFFWAHAVILVIAAWQPRRLGSITWAPLIGRGLMVGLWLWLLGSERLHMARNALWVLVGHDAAVLLLLSMVLMWVWVVREPIVHGSPRLPEARG